MRWTRRAKRGTSPGAERSAAAPRRAARKATPAAEPPMTVYEARKGWALLNLRELWKYRELMFFLGMRDVKVRYRQAVLGIAWVVIMPLAQMVVGTLVFNKALGVQSPIAGVDFFVFNLSGVILWTYFSSSLSRTSGALVGQAGLLTKVYFPRLVIPSASMVTGLVDFFIGLVILAVMMAVLGVAVSWHLIFFPLFVLMTLLTALGAGLWLGPLNVLYRDVGSIVPFIVQLGVFLCPVYYPISKFDAYPAVKAIFSLNPMTGAVDGFRWSLLGGEFSLQYFWYSLAVVLVLLVSGLFFFKRMERMFADVV
jgi:lipopolysaccharide transport system permease protein